MSNFYQLSNSCQIARFDMYLDDVFGEKHDGIFIDVGSYDGIWTSNTYQLAKLGWQGLMIEPVPTHFKKLTENIQKEGWTNVKPINYAVGSSDEGEVKMFVKGTLSTINQKQMEAFKHFDWCKDRFDEEPENIKVPLITLNTILKTNNIKKIDVLSIDVEGYEFEVLKGFDIDYWKPKMVIIETCGLHNSYNDYPELRQNMIFINHYMNKPDYTLYYKDYINSIWILK